MSYKIIGVLGHYHQHCLLSQVPPFGSRGGLLLAWRLGVYLECFNYSTNNISAWCYFDLLSQP
jgi:hypothetical protein